MSDSIDEQQFLTMLGRLPTIPEEILLLAEYMKLATALYEIRDLPEERLDEAPGIARRVLREAAEE